MRVSTNSTIICEVIEPYPQKPLNTMSRAIVNNLLAWSKDNGIQRMEWRSNGAKFYLQTQIGLERSVSSHQRFT